MGKTFLGDIPGNDAEIVKFGVAAFTAGVAANIDLGAEFSTTSGELAIKVEHLPGGSDAVSDLTPPQVTKVTNAVAGTSNTKITIRAAKLVEGTPNTIGADTSQTGSLYWIALGKKL